jgi:hypothetical protein
VGVGATGGEKCLGATPGFGSFFGAAGGTLCIVEGIADMLGFAWWYFDSTSFPYQLLWRFSLSIFSMRR